MATTSIMHSRRHPPSSPPPPSYGTAVAVVIGENNVAYLVADGRSLSNEEPTKGHINKGCAAKLFSITDYVVCAVCGRSDAFYGILSVIRDVPQSTDVYEIANICEEYVGAWKRKKENKHQRFPARVTLCGSTKDGLVVIVISQETHITREKNIVVASGSGQPYIETYVRPVLQNERLDDNAYMNCMLEGVVYACLHSSMCGGIFNVAKVPLGKKVKYYQGFHLLEYLADFKSKFEGYMDNKVIYLSQNTEYSYAVEESLGEKIRNMVNNLKNFHVLGIKKSSERIVRVVEFADSDQRDIGFQVLKRSDLQGKDTRFFLPTDEVLTMLGKMFDTENIEEAEEDLL